MINISEITGMDENVISMQEIFTFVTERDRAERQGDRRVPSERHPAEVPGAAARLRHSLLPSDV